MDPITMLARRGLSSLINGLMEGDPVAWGALGIGILVAGITWYFKSRSNSN
ncbi:MAG: hypothetical protein U0996_22455 [Planctomycetaceae bacterium]